MQPPIRITPRFKMLLIYNIRPEVQDGYYRYVLREFIPAVQEKGIYMFMAWQVAYGDYPSRRIEFLIENEEDIRDLFNSVEWIEMEDKLKSYTSDYTRKVMRYRSRFQL